MNTRKLLKATMLDLRPGLRSGLIGGGAIVLIACLLIPQSQPAHANETETLDYTEMSLEELMNLEIVSVSKKPESLNDAAAAVFVVTADDIQRSGVTTIPDALRMVPGVQVARIDANKWAVTARGFNDRFANKLLVLIDGRSVYTSLYSGVFWDVQGVTLENVDRIEVIRGPGATMWGANAVNGVINIITKGADQTTGAYVATALGTEERGLGILRYGGHDPNRNAYRLNIEYARRDNTVDMTGENSFDEWDLLRGGGRYDLQVSEQDAVSFSANYYQANTRSLYNLPSLQAPYFQFTESVSEMTEFSAQLNWSHSWSATSQLELIAYYTASQIEDVLTTDDRQIFDIEFQQPFTLGSRHALVWGLGYRRTMDHLRNGTATFLPSAHDEDLINGFIQDDITLIQNRLRAIFGAKVENNNFEDTYVQPNARFVWTPRTRHTVWGAYSRAIRTPSRAETGIFYDVRVAAPMSDENPQPLPMVLRAIGSDDLPPEELQAYELGYRVQPFASFSIDLATFLNEYDNLRSYDMGEPSVVMDPVTPHIILPSYFGTNTAGQTWGAELAMTWRPSHRWQLHTAYNYLDSDLYAKSSEIVATVDYSSLRSPLHQFSLRSSTDLTPNLQSGFWVKYTDGISELDIPAHWNLDVRVGWRIVAGMELEVVGQNLLHTEQVEFLPLWIYTNAAAVQRGLYGKVSWWF